MASKTCILFLLLLPSARSCGPGVANNDYCKDGKCVNPLQALGGQARLTGEIPGENANGQDYIQDGRDLRCENWDDTCRWRNEPNGAGRDVLDYGQGDGKWDPLRGDIAFGTRETPAGRYAATGAVAILDRSDNAMIVSDPIPCQNGDASLKFRYWTTKGAEVRACTRVPNDGNRYIYCSPAITGGDPGPAIVRIPGPIDEPFELVIEASGFVYNENGAKGGAVILDDVEYDGDVCDRVPETTTRRNSDDNKSPGCNALFCTFDRGNCAPDLGNGWSVHGDPFGNRHTGIRAPLDGKFAVARGGGVDPKIQSPPFQLSKDELLSFCYYRPAAESNLVVYAVQRGSQSQIFKSPSFQIGKQYEWKCDKVLLKQASYDSVEFVAEGLRNQYSYMGVDQIELFDPSSNNPLC